MTLLGLLLLSVVAALSVSEGSAEGPEVVEHALSLLRPGVQDRHGWGKETPASTVLVLHGSSAGGLRPGGQVEYLYRWIGLCFE